MSRPNLPNPLTAPECDLRDFAFMPLDVRRLLTSETWIEAADDPKLGHALMSLWCESWHQVPAGSLPDKDTILARYAMCDRAEWDRIKDRALQGWVRCSDGRLYHPVTAEKAADAWTHKLARRQQTKRATEERERRRRESDRQRDVSRNAPRNDRRNVDQGRERGRETGTGTMEEASASLDLSAEEWFWSRLDGLEAKGVRRSQCTKLLKLTGHDFAEANRVLDAAEPKKKPSQYLGAAIRNMEMAGRTMPAGQNPHVPAWVNEQRASGVPVERQGKLWRCQGELRDEAGEVVGW